MRFSWLLSRLAAPLAVVAAVVVAIGILVAFEPATRNLVGQDDWCNTCHLKADYDPTAKMSWTSVHPATPDGGQARCVDCHLPEGLAASVYVYTHILSLTDLFGRARDREAEKRGPWVEPVAKLAYRVRDRLMEYDSITCRSCHIESEIKPKQRRGQKAHERALKKEQTCIECHDNFVHREVPSRT